MVAVVGTILSAVIYSNLKLEVAKVSYPVQALGAHCAHIPSLYCTSFGSFSEPCTPLVSHYVKPVDDSHNSLFIYFFIILFLIHKVSTATQKTHYIESCLSNIYI